MLHIRNLDLELGEKKILNNIAFDVGSGDILTIIGASGCGKSSILKSIAGIHRTPTASIVLDGREISSLSIEKRNTVLVFQDFVLFPHMTIAENMNIATSNIHIHQTILEKLDVYEHYEKFPHQLSGGEQQRVALARAIAHQPKLLLLDEPFSNIDAITTVTVRQTVLELLRELKITTVMVTHDINDVWTVGDKVAVVKNGRVEACDTAINLYEFPPSLFVAKKMGSVINYNNTYYRPENVMISTDINKFKSKGKIVANQNLGMYNNIKIKTSDTILDVIDLSKQLEINQAVSFDFKKKLNLEKE